MSALKKTILQKMNRISNKDMKLIRASAVFLLLAVFSFSGTSLKSQTTADTIDHLVQRYIDLGKFNGSILVVKDHEIIYDRTHGISNPETNEQLTPAHRYRLASVTKHLTGVAIMILKEQGKLDYDDDIRIYLSELPYDGITIRNLLTHSSGLPDYGQLLDRYWDTVHRGSPDRKIACNYNVYDLLVAHHPPTLFNPGEKRQYSNTGYNLLALVVEKVSGQTYHEFMKNKVFDPAAMNHSFVNAPDGKLPDYLRARGFREDPVTGKSVLSDQHYQNGMFGDGGIYSTIGDMARWDVALYTDNVVNQEILKEAFAKSFLNNGEAQNYGFGWSILESPNGDFVAHGGGWAGFSTFFLRDYQNGNMVIQLTNRPGIRRGALVFAIYDILRGKAVELPKWSVREAMLRELDQHDMDAAIKLYFSLKKDKQDKYEISEQELNLLGYTLLQQNRIPDAISIFQLNIDEHTESFNVYDSMGEACMKNGDNELAIEYYQKSIDLNPANEHGKKMLQKLREEQQ